MRFWNVKRIQTRKWQVLRIITKPYDDFRDLFLTQFVLFYFFGPDKGINTIILFAKIISKKEKKKNDEEKNGIK